MLVYSGSIGGWYLTEEMISFFVAMLSRLPSVHLLCLTTNGQDQVEAILKARGAPPESYTIKSVSSEEVSSYLSACDAGIAFIKPCFSKFASSPTKNAEYLACGLPLIINSGIGDSDSLIRSEGVGAMVSDFTQVEYEAAAATILSMLEDPLSGGVGHAMWRENSSTSVGYGWSAMQVVAEVLYGTSQSQATTRAPRF